MRSILLTSLLFFSLSSHGKTRVTIDPGHGGEDKGAVHGSVAESKVALQISQKLFRRLQKDPTFASQILRNKDRSLSLEQRVQASNRFQSDLFISIHANAHPNSRAKGAEFYIENQLPVKQENLRLAHSEITAAPHPSSDKVIGDIGSILGDLQKNSRIVSSYQLSSYLRESWKKRKKKMIRQGPFYVLNQSHVPAVLVEVGYLSNSKERSQLIQSKEQERIAEKIHNALKGFTKNMDKLPLGILKRQNAKTR